MRRFLLSILLLPIFAFSAAETIEKKYTFFAELNYLSEVGRENGEDFKDSASFQTSKIPYLQIPTFIRAYAEWENLPYSEVANSNSIEMYNILDEFTTKRLNQKERHQLISNAVKMVEFSKVKSRSEMKTYLNENIRSASFGEKTVFLANMLSLLEDNYDLEMVQEGYNEEKVTDMDMILALNKVILTGVPASAGVCRHMHQFAIRIAKEVGIDNAFGVGYRTDSSGHRTIVLGVPGSPSQVVQLNYGTKNEFAHVTGTSALTQNHSIPSTGIRFSIYNGNDTASIILPSEQGGLLNLLSGGNNSDLAYGYETESLIQQFGIKTPYGTFRAFKANGLETDNSKFEGIGYDVSFKFFKFFSNHLGFAGFQNQRRVLNDEILKIEGIYLRNKLSFNWEFYTGEKLNISTFADLNLRLSLFCTTYEDYNCEPNQDLNANLNSGFKAEYKFQKASIRSEVRVHTQVANKHASYTTRQTLIIPAVTLINSLKLKLSEDFSSEHEVSTTHYDLGTNAYNVFNSINSVHSKAYDLELYHSYGAPITDNTPVWLPGAAKVTRYGARKTFLSKKIELNANYESRAYELEKFFGINIKVVY
ncbi:MAG: hypothetical protein ACJAS4_000116 [Bacteriovoracaceae bacterium]|jgi:hypothetical protein